MEEWSYFSESGKEEEPTYNMRSGCCRVDWTVARRFSAAQTALASCPGSSWSPADMAGISGEGCSSSATI